MMSSPDEATAQHVHRTLRTLELLAEGPQTQAEVARHLAVHRRTARRLLARLVGEGYAEPARRGRHVSYVATARLAVLGHKAAEGLDMMAIGRRCLAKLDGTPLAGRFIAALAETGVSVAHVEHQLGRGTSTDISLALSGPLHATAAGKVFLSADTALLSDALNHDLIAFTEHTITTRADLLLELAIVRKRGYAIEDGEHRAGFRTVASGVTNHVGKVVAALGAMPAPNASSETLGEPVREAALEFSRQIGGVGVD